MTKKYLLFWGENEIAHPINDLFKFKIFDSRSFVYEKSINNFLNYKGDLKRIFFFEERTMALNEMMDHPDLHKLDCMFFADFGGGTDVYIIEHFKNWVQRNKIPDDKIYAFMHSRTEWDVVKKITGLTRINFICTEENLQIALREHLSKPLRKRFMFLSRNWSDRRLITFVDLMRRGVLDNSYYSFFNITNIYDEKHIYYTPDEINHEFHRGISEAANYNPDWAEQLITYWEEEKERIISGMPYLIEGEKQELDGEVGVQCISETLNNAYNNSAMSLLIETSNTNSRVHFQCTEKTYKAMLFRHPFLVYGDMYQLERTRQFGFKTYGNFLDESYDTMDSSYKRIFAINEQVDRLNRLSDFEFKKKMHEMSGIAAENYNLLMHKFLQTPQGVATMENENSEIRQLLKSDLTEAWYNYG